jgi:DNA-binding NtrC family response regulator
MSFQVELVAAQETTPKAIQALLMDDNTFDRARIRRMSGNTNLKVDLIEVSNMSDMEDAVAKHAFDIILIDYRLPQGDGLEALVHIQQSDLNSSAGTIMITGQGDTQTAVTALRKGCHDFLTKDAMTADYLRQAMIGAIEAAKKHRDRGVQILNQNEVIRKGFAAALMDPDIQETLVALFRDQFRGMHAPTQAAIFGAEDHSELDALLASVDDNDEFIFN